MLYIYFNEGHLLNKTKFFTSAILFHAAYAPLYLILFIRDFHENLLGVFNLNSANNQSYFFDYTLLLQNGCITPLILLSSLLCCLIVNVVNRLEGENLIEVLQIRNKSSEIVNYTVPFMVSFFNFNIGNFKDLLSLAIFMLLLFLLSIRTQSIFVNPVLALVGYGLYEIDYEENGVPKTCTFISRKSLHQKEFYRSTSLSNYLKIITSKEK